MTARAATCGQPAEARIRLRLALTGIVQGVGFRPFVHALAARHGIAGHVANTPAGLVVEAEGPPETVERFARTLAETPPENAIVRRVMREAMAPTGRQGFTIRDSVLAGNSTASVLPDLGTCDACLAEIFSPGNRRYRYAFTNCTHCGPRYSIVAALPYDRARTAMRDFPMCAACRAEYDDPADRRFHAEATCCPDCGPRLALWDSSGANLAAGDAALLAAADAIRAGQIVAIKGIGGFHLMADARNETAAARLRLLKRRGEKPFAVMFPSIDAIEAACCVGDAERTLLTGRARPIVLLRAKSNRLAPSIAPGNPRLGAMLPYAPLHHLLLAELGFPIVATSGNLSEEPIATDEREALARLAGIAALLLVHNRPILRALDDSVAQIVAGRPQVIRRARGFAPLPVAEAESAGVLAVGGHLKASVALTTEAGIVLGAHIGDLDDPLARDAHRRSAADLAALHRVSPRVVAHDLHPDYASSQLAGTLGLPAIAVQHHVAHVAACMAEHGLNPPVLGVAFDGSGDGGDGTIWGGEFILIDHKGWRRVAHLRPFGLPGGGAAVREPRRAGLGLLLAGYGARAAGMTGLPTLRAFTAAERRTLARMMEAGLNSPVTTSVGRLFDAVASLAGLRQGAGYEGQAAMLLEAAADPGEAGSYAFDLRNRDGMTVVDWQPMLDAMLADIGAGIPAGTVSRRFHAGLAGAVAGVAGTIGATDVALTGGCFQNVLLSELTIAALRARGLTPWWHQQVPPNDGGLAVGQAAWAARMIEKGEGRCASPSPDR